MAVVAVAVGQPSSADRLKAALWFASRGFQVFSVWSTDKGGTCRCPKGAACTSPGKHPIPQKGFQDATTDPGRITTMLSAASDPNWGMVCPEGVFALDVDGDDLARFAVLETELGPLPPTLRTRTANGQHIFLRWPETYPRPIKHMFGFVTRWGSGKEAGYVIGPRSIHSSGFAYEPDGPLEIAETPARWAEAALAAQHRPATGSDTDIRGPEPLPTTGHRHEWLRDRARYYWGMTGDLAVTRAAVRAENNKLDEPKTEEEVDRAIGEVQQFAPDPPAVVDEKVARRLGDDALDFLPARSGVDFPAPPSPAAFGGLLGELVDDLATGTDASMVGLLGSLIAFCGALLPGQAYFHRIQTSSPFVALVGESSVGRKGTAMMRAHDAMANTLGHEYVNRVILDGLASGEGLVTTMHYKQTTFPAEPAVGLVFEEEYATLLAARSREGSTLDPKMRQAFDGGRISNRRSGEQKSVDPPYWLPALIAITPGELRERLESGAMASGSANRWLYLAVTRRDLVPTNADPRFSMEHHSDLGKAFRWARDEYSRPLRVHPEVVRVLADYQDWLPTVTYGLARDLTRRLGVIAFRIALTHALLEQSEQVELFHLDRALALTEYARAGIAWIFGDTIGNRDADLLLRYLQATGRLRKTNITREIIRDPLRQQSAIDELQRLGLAHLETGHPEGRGRPFTELVSSTKSAFFHGFDSASLKKASNLGTDGTISVNGWKEAGKISETTRKEVTDGGTEWCLFYREHQSRHRDVNTSPWCEICTPRLEENRKEGGPA